MFLLRGDLNEIISEGIASFLLHVIRAKLRFRQEQVAFAGSSGKHRPWKEQGDGKIGRACYVGGY